MKPSATHLTACSACLGKTKHGHQTDQGNKPEGGQQQVVAHGAVTSSGADFDWKCRVQISRSQSNAAGLDR